MDINSSFYQLRHTYIYIIPNGGVDTEVTVDSWDSTARSCDNIVVEWVLKFREETPNNALCLNADLPSGTPTPRMDLGSPCVPVG